MKKLNAIVIALLLTMSAHAQQKPKITTDLNGDGVKENNHCCHL